MTNHKQLKRFAEERAKQLHNTTEPRSFARKTLTCQVSDIWGRKLPALLKAGKGSALSGLNSQLLDFTLRIKLTKCDEENSHFKPSILLMDSSFKRASRSLERILSKSSDEDFQIFLRDGAKLLLCPDDVTIWKLSV